MTDTRSSPAISTGSRSSSRGTAVFLSYCLLASVYLLYLRHADFVLDDWFQFAFYRAKQVRGLSGELEVLRTLLQNKLYSVFQIFWLGYAVDSLVVWVVGYAPRVLFAMAVAVHTLNAWLCYRLWLRLHVDPRLAYAAGAFCVLIPTAHGSLFWTLNTGYYRLSPVFLLLYWLSLAKIFDEGRLRPRAAATQAVLAAAALFAGGAIQFFLLLFGGAWIALCLFPRDDWKTAAQATVLNWAVVALAMGIYVRFINRIPPDHAQIRARYDFSGEFLVRNWRKFYQVHLAGISGLGRRPYYRLELDWMQLTAAALAITVVVWVVRRLGAEKRALDAPSAWRVAIFALGMTALAYAPLVFLFGGTLRHYYTISPYVALLVAALCQAVPGRRLRAAAAGLVAGYFAMCTVAEIEQNWIPMSRHTQALKAGLLRLQNLAPGDHVVIPGTPVAIGAAPHFALISGPFDTAFADVVTGVDNVLFWREIVIENGHVRFFHRHSMRDTSVEELRRSHVLVGHLDGPYMPRYYWAEPAGPDRYLLHCLKDGPCAPPAGPVTAEQLRAYGDQVYVAKPFVHGDIKYLHY